eukprot:PhM_4_TR18809/c1_g1_i1/m.32262
MKQPTTQTEKQRLVVGHDVYGTPNSYNNNNSDVVQGTPLYDEEHTAAASGRFTVKPNRDHWAAVLFIGSLVAMCVRVAYAFHNHEIKFSTNDKSDNNSSFDGVSHAALFRAVVVGGCGAVIFSYVALALMKVVPRGYIITTNLATIAVEGVVAYFLFINDFVYMGVLLTVCAVLHLIWLLCAWSRIALAAILLRTSASLTFHYPATMVISVYSLLVSHAVYFVSAAALLSWMERSTDVDYNGDKHTHLQVRDGCGGYVLLGLLFLFWGIQVVINVVHVTVSGLSATVYFLSTNMPVNPTMKSFKRAMTSSFGSICFGSLVVAIFQLLYAICRAFASRHRRNIIALCAMCLIGILRRLIEWFNVYAFTYIAIYGDAYLTAASRAWNLITAAPCAVVFNDALISSAVSLTVVLAGFIGWVVGHIALKSMAAGFVVGLWCLVVSLLLLRVVYINVVTLFVCVAEAPDTLRLTNPELHAEIVAAVSNSSVVNERA